MVTHDNPTCLMGERPILSALQKMLCQMCYLMLTISMALVRLLAAGLTAAADIVDANIVDIPEPEVAPATLECTSADVADKKGQRVLAVPSPDDSAAEIDPKDGAERAQLQAQLDALLAEKYAMAEKLSLIHI